MLTFFKLSWRNVWRNRRRTTIALLAMSLALTLIITFDGMMESFTTVMYGKSVKLEGGNVLVHAPGYQEKVFQLPLLPIPQDAADAAVLFAQKQPDVIAASQRIETGGLLSSREGSFPATLIGVRPDLEGQISPVAENMVSGRYLNLEDEDQILIGHNMASDLDVVLGDRVTLTGRASHSQTRQRTMTVVGVYKLGAADLEGDVFMTLSEAQTLFNLSNQVTEIGVYLEDVGKEDPTVARMQAALPGYEVLSWDTLDPTLTDAMAIDQQFMEIMNIVILIIAGVGIFNLMLMVVVERTREIGLISALGLKRREIMILFLLEGSFLGLISTAAGVALGVFLNWLGGLYGLPMPGGASVSELGSIYALMGDRIYFTNTPELILQRAVLVVAVAAIASLYPAWRAASQEPTQALHHI